MPKKALVFLFRPLKFVLRINLLKLQILIMHQNIRQPIKRR